jgi:hypothetical protein
MAKKDTRRINGTIIHPVPSDSLPPPDPPVVEFERSNQDAVYFLCAITTDENAPPFPKMYSNPPPDGFGALVGPDENGHFKCPCPLPPDLPEGEQTLYAWVACYDDAYILLSGIDGPSDFTWTES